ncbi:SusD/RagB family nutrient-binding outer membrane lipoprotein [Persicitalea sp.]|uniref:SusD/RagB family nutrient-binding outer membrane lipoprotein n=1 Tax=Persicitalea sp. TaxID=3100273 RepID=UPI0035947682
MKKPLQKEGKLFQLMKISLVQLFLAVIFAGFTHARDASAPLTSPSVSFPVVIQPDRQITGTVTDESGAGLPGVSILVEGTSKGTTTLSDGTYNISVSDGSTTFVFSFVGYLLPQVEVSYVTEIAGGGTALSTNFLSEANTFVLGNNTLQAVQNMGGQAREQAYLALNDLAILKKKAIDSNAPTYAGIADVLRALNLAALSDWFGDIPYSEALRSDIVNPAFDKSSNIYPEIQKILDEAIVNLRKDSGPLAPNVDDLIFNGNKALWIKTAYGLKARLYSRLSNVDPTGSANNALSAIGQSFSSDAENFVFSKFTDLLKITDPTGRPNRIPYPVSEVTRNTSTPTDIDNISTFEARTKVFWAKK